MYVNFNGELLFFSLQLYSVHVLTYKTYDESNICDKPFSQLLYTQQDTSVSFNFTDITKSTSSSFCVTFQ